MPPHRHAAAMSRIQELLALYGSPTASAADLLCDCHAQDALAYRVIGPDLQPTDLTYGMLRVESEKFAAALAELGLGPGDRVATAMTKGAEYLIALLGIWRLGAVHVPIFTAFASPAIAFRLTSSSAKLVICDAPQQAKLQPGGEMPASLPWQVVSTAGADTLLPGMLSFSELLGVQMSGRPAATLGGDAPIIQIYTSGTTGTPKGVIVPLRALASFRTYAEFALGLRADDFFWNAADPGWAYGLYFGVLASLSTGVPSLLLQAGFDSATTFNVLAQNGITNFAAAPTVYRSLRACTEPHPRITLRCASSAGEPLTPEVNLWAREALGVDVHDHYGQTETGMLINNHHHPDLAAPLKPGAMGTPMPGWSITVLKDQEDVSAPEGELGRVAIDWPASPLAWFTGYAGDPQKTAEKYTADGRWYLTGDAGTRDADGYFHFSSRDDDIIIMAGYRISPFEIESVISTHPAVLECAVIAAPDTTRGEVLEAYAVLQHGEETSAAQERSIQNWVKTRYGAHAYPRQVHFCASLPKTASGKVQRFILRQQRRAELAKETSA